MDSITLRDFQRTIDEQRLARLYRERVLRELSKAHRRGQQTVTRGRLISRLRLRHKRHSIANAVLDLALDSLADYEGFPGVAA